MRKILGTCGLLFTLATHAQTAAKPRASIVPDSNVIQLQAVAGGCPATLSTSRLPGSNLLQAGLAGDQGAIRRGSFGFRVTFLPGILANPQIAQAKVTFHGTEGPGIQLAGDQDSKAGASEAFLLAPWQSGHEWLHSTVYTHKLTGVRWIELNEITWRDGSTWQESAEGACRFVPNGLMLVTSGH